MDGSSKIESTGYFAGVPKIVKNSIFYQLLQRGDFFEGIYWQRHTFPQNSVILKEGSQSGKVFFILDGVTRISGVIEWEGRKRMRPGVRDLEAGEVFGELALMDNMPHSTTVTAVTSCEIAVIDGKSLQDYLSENQEMGYQVYKAISKTLVTRLRKTNEKVFSLLAWGLKERGFHELL